MKILVVSLLRLGDIIMHLHVIRGIKQKYPGAEVHLLINAEFAGLGELFEKEVERVIQFPRQYLQETLVEPEHDSTKGFRVLDQFLKSELSSFYDVTFNLTHTRLSAYLLGLVSSKRVYGLHVDQFGFRGFENIFLREFDVRFSGTSQSVFHYVEWLGLAMGVEPQRSPMLENQGKRILFQVETSDAKKNISLDLFRDAILSLENMGYHCFVLASPSEVKKFADIFGLGRIIKANLMEVVAELRQCRALVSLDTGIKHLAGFLGVPVLEISVGSSDPMKTSVYFNHGQKIIGSSDCYPCSHSQKCSKLTHLCEQKLTSHEIFHKAMMIANGDAGLIDQWDSRYAEVKAIWIKYFEGKLTRQYQMQISTPEFFRDSDSPPRVNLELWAFYRSIRDVLFAESGLTSQGAGKLLVLLNQLNDVSRDPAGIFSLLKSVSRSLHADETKLLYELRMALAESRTLLDLVEIRNLEFHVSEKNMITCADDSAAKLSNLDWVGDSVSEDSMKAPRNDKNQLDGDQK